MSIDLTQFHQVFFEESFEGLEIMERGLLKLQPGNKERDPIDEIFRAAHSIKGGAGTFGFNTITEFTHDLETLLDEMREGLRDVTQEAIELLLKSVDCLRDMLDALHSKQEPNLDVATALTEAFENLLGQEDDLDNNSGEEIHCDDKSHQWEIYFRPDVDVLRTGNEPYRLFRELRQNEHIEEYKIEIDVSHIPDFSKLHPEECYLAWSIFIKGKISREEIEYVFEWVVDDSELVIEDRSQAGSAKQSDIAAGFPNQEAGAEIVQLTTIGNSDNSIEGGNEVAQSEKSAPAVMKKEMGNRESASIRVGIDKIDELINMVGELVITQSMLGQLGKDFRMERLPDLVAGLSQLEHNTRELQESVMKIRMVPMSFAFSRFPRLVRDISQQLSKQVNLKLLGEQTELDKTVMEKIGDPLTHLVRNSLDHGLEPPEERVAIGKPETGELVLNAFHQGGSIVIEVRDDGRGLDGEKILAKARSKGLVGGDEVLAEDRIHDLIFQPGFSTAEEVSDISGRGVGMDVVRKNIQSLNGSVEVQSQPGKGSVFSIRLPLTLAILDGQLIRVGEEIYILPLISIVESTQVNPDYVNFVAGQCDVYRLRSEYIPILKAFDLFSIEADNRQLENGLMVVLESGGTKVGMIVDELLDQQQVVIKSLETNYKRVEGISGATILGDGTVALIVDVNGIIKMASRKYEQSIQQLHRVIETGNEAA